jgi:UDP-N-acetylglucosamine diphosphorylase / glucose-1-phosphate thymidylyltransferase / UDP-N-acetylgalactosamine diphosphorylase / glucosamine-1-phosphate N-acetyltransferase / galactosamine-1-phosphate N-acetyltransferase
MSLVAGGRRRGSPGAASVEGVDCVLLCAGIGKRLRPLTDSIPKALVPVAGRPIVDYHLEAWHAAGVRRAILVTGYRGDQVQDHVGNGERYGLDVEFVTQSEPRGSGHALLVAADRLEAPRLLVGYCDVFFGRSPSVWTTLLADDRPKIVGAYVPDAGAYGRLAGDGERPWPRLLAIHEKDRVPTPGLINAGAYLLPRRVVEIMRSIPLSPRGEIELTDGLTEYLTEGGEIRIVPTPEWVDIGTPEQLEIATRRAGSPPETDPAEGHSPAVGRATEPSS